MSTKGSMEDEGLKRYDSEVTETKEEAICRQGTARSKVMRAWSVNRR